jgi:predicted Zn-dependent protease
MNAAMGGSAAKAMDAVSEGAGFVGQFGLGGAEEAKTGAEVAKVVDQLLAEYPLTANEERMISRQCLAQAIGSTPILPPEHPVSAYVNWVGGWVAAQSSLPYPASGLDFVVLEDRSTINAMAMPGGPILITTGMLEFLQSEDELAFLLGHEMAHVEERHAFKQLNDNRLIRKLASLISINNFISTGKFDGFLSAVMARGNVPASLQPDIDRLARAEVRDLLARAVEEIRDTAIDQVINAADQGIETAADLRGLSLAAAAGYNPAAVELLLERFRSFRGDYGGAKYSDNRLAEARLVIPKLPSRDGGRCKTLEELGGQVVPSSRAQKNWANLQRLLAAR